MSMGSLLHVGCGGDSMPEWAVGKFNEVRLDICEDVRPDIVASMTDMGDIGQFDVLYCSHALEHLFPHDVQTALGEFRRVLKDGGFAIVFVPDLEDIKASEETLFDSPCGPISGMDLIYGKRDAVEIQPYMAHHTGFTAVTLQREFEQAGFGSVTVRRMPSYNLMAVASK
jgi:SAM-dependent methyltransferase